jgi:hypothetical protein
LKGEQRDPRDRIDRTHNSTLIRRFCHWPVGVGVSPASIPDSGDRRAEGDETVASVAFVSYAYCADIRAALIVAALCP